MIDHLAFVQPTQGTLNETTNVGSRRISVPPTKSIMIHFPKMGIFAPIRHFRERKPIICKTESCGTNYGMGEAHYHTRVKTHTLINYVNYSWKRLVDMSSTICAKLCKNRRNRQNPSCHLSHSIFDFRILQSKYILEIWVSGKQLNFSRKFCARSKDAFK